MASIKERIETVFAAMAFAERGLEEESLDLLGQARDRGEQSAPRAKRPDSRPRARV